MADDTSKAIVDGETDNRVYEVSGEIEVRTGNRVYRVYMKSHKIEDIGDASLWLGGIVDELLMEVRDSERDG